MNILRGIRQDAALNEGSQYPCTNDRCTAEVMKHGGDGRTFIWHPATDTRAAESQTDGDRAAAAALTACGGGVCNLPTLLFFPCNVIEYRMENGRGRSYILFI